VVTAVVAVVAGLALATLPWLIDTARVRAMVAASVSQALARPVTLDGLEVDLFPAPTVVVTGIEVAEDRRVGAEPLLTVPRADVRLRAWPLLRGRLELAEIVLRRPRLVLADDPSGPPGNVGTASEEPGTFRPRPGGPSTPALAGVVARMALEDGTVVHRGLAPYRVEALDLRVSGAGGRISVEGEGELQPGGLKLELRQASVHLAGAARPGEARVEGRLALRGHDVAALLAPLLGPGTEATGTLLEGTLAVEGTLGRLRLAGDLTLADARLTRTDPGCRTSASRSLALGTVTAHTIWHDGQLLGRPVTARPSRGAISANVSAAVDEGLRITIEDIEVRQVPAEAVLVDFLCLRHAVTGPLDLTGTLALRPGAPWTTLSGGGQLRIGAGKVVGPRTADLARAARLGGVVSRLLDAKLPSGLDQPFAFESITGTYDITSGVMTTRDLRYRGPAITATLTGDYALATGQMDLDVLVDHDGRRLKARLTGTNASPSIRLLPSAHASLSAGRAGRSRIDELLRRLR
jgi:uncharacterized protein involved in outer membrane biogenesis